MTCPLPLICEGFLFMRKCNINNCENKHKGHGLCDKHLKKLKKYGDPLFGKESEQHGMKKTKEYTSWCLMKRRCFNKKREDYKDYGGRGITVCDEWKNSFLAFYNDMGPRPTDKHSIDRIDNNKGYYKENCKWSTPTEQARNKRIQKNNKTGCPGVYFCNTTQKYKATITVKDKTQSLGYFKELKKAIEVRKEAELKYWE